MRRPCVFWNVQRLFEPAGGPVARSMGASSRDWTRADYDRKVANIADCLTRLTGGERPALLGFAEVETLGVVRDICERAGWGALVSVDETVPAPELSGHDVALLYDPGVFDRQPAAAQSLTLNNVFDTRDLLRVRLVLKDLGQPVEVLVAHWPSRLISEGAILRIAHSYFLRGILRRSLKFAKADLFTPDGGVAMPDPDTLRQRWATPCIVMGDFNDEPFDESVRHALGSSRLVDTVQSASRLVGKALAEPDNYLAADFTLFNPCWSPPFSDTGTLGGSYYRSPEWRIYDQVMVSHGALDDAAPLRFVQGSLRVGRLEDFAGSGGPVRMTTATGLPNAFEGSDPEGVSDHLPMLWAVDIDPAPGD